MMWRHRPWQVLQPQVRHVYSLTYALAFSCCFSRASFGRHSWWDGENFSSFYISSINLEIIWIYKEGTHASFVQGSTQLGLCMFFMVQNARFESERQWWKKKNLLLLHILWELKTSATRSKSVLRHWEPPSDKSGWHWQAGIILTITTLTIHTKALCRAYCKRGGKDFV